MLITRPLLAADQELLWDMLLLALWQPDKGIPSRAVLERPEIRIYAENWGRAGDVGVVAELDGAESPAGVCWMRPVPKDLGSAYVDDETPQLGIAFQPPFQQQGLGRPLLLAGLDAARHAGYKQVALTVHPENAACSLYKRFGFEVIGERGPLHLMLARL